MKRLILILILAATSTASASTEYLRPTADSGPATVYSGCSTGTRDAGELAGSLGTAYNSKSGAGPTGSSAAGTVAYADQGAQDYDQDVFGYGGTYTAWQTPPAGTLSSASVNISIKNAITNSASSHVYYTTNSGGTWTSMGAVTASQSTLSVSISSMSGLGVMVCGQSGTGSTSSVTVTVYDVWVAWVYTASTSHTYTWLLSYLDEQIWRWHDGVLCGMVKVETGVSGWCGITSEAS